MKVTVRTDISGALQRLELLTKDQLPFATAVALTKTAQAVKGDLATEMRSIFSHPRKYTLNSLAITRATKQNPTACVYVRSPSVANSLKAEIRGGVRDKAIEKVLGDVLPAGMFAVPGTEAKRDGEGKISISWVKGLLVKLGITTRVSKSGKRSRRMASASTGYFLLLQPNGRLRAGIYQRRARQVLPLIIFTRQPSYGEKFAFYGIGADSARKHFPEEFRQAADAALASAR
jgi:hypothetical protein